MYLGIDIGTSSVKIAILSEENQIISSCSSSLRVIRDKPFFSEQDPSSWIEATKKSLQKLPKVYRDSIKTIGLTGQMHGAVLLDKNAQVLRRAILWNDGRSDQECKELEKSVPSFKEITGNLLMPGFTAPKILWVKKHEPKIFDQINQVLLPKDYIRLYLSGDFATDLSDASGTAWLDVKNRTWSKKMLSASFLTENQMPKLYEGSDVTGTVSAKVARDLGMSPSTKIVAGGGDNACSALAVGVFEEGKAFLSLGTSGVYFVSKEKYLPKPDLGVHTYCHALKNLWHQMTVHLSSASCFSFLEKIHKAPIKELVDEAKNEPNKTHKVFFLPYLSGERTPYNDPYARGVFFGLSHRTTRAQMTLAVMEGTAFALKSGQKSMLAKEIKDIYLIGGGAKDLLWAEIIASILEKPLKIPKENIFGAAQGAARLARFQDLSMSYQEAFSPSKKEDTIYPIEKLFPYYRQKEGTFLDLYSSLKRDFKKIAQLEDFFD